MKLYTKSGDDGSTGLYSGQRVGKDSPRVEACGAIDELNSALGLAGAACTHEEITTILLGVGHLLIDMGADLATLTTPGSISAPRSVSGSAPGVASEGKARVAPTITSDHVDQIEKQIDEVDGKLAPLRQFILPGGCELAARLHVARTACRCAERRCVSLARSEQVNPHVLIYLNRLSDLLFALARRANQLEGVEDVVWPGRGK